MDEEKMCYDRDEIIQILKDLEVLVVSLDRIGSSYHDRESEEQNNAVVARFLVEFGVFKKLAFARRILSDAFSREAGEDGMDELERLFRNLTFWQPAD